jgi:hypothetical protein
MMQKVLFTAFAELKQGDGKGPKFFAGKAYWLSPDQAVRWKSEGVAEDAPADMAAENEPQTYLPNPKDVRLVRVSRGRFDVLGLSDHKYNEQPLTADAAEKLRKRVLAGEAAAPVPAPTVAAAPAAVGEEGAGSSKPSEGADEDAPEQEVTDTAEDAEVE